MRFILLAAFIFPALLAVGSGNATGQGWTAQSSGVTTTLYEVLMTDLNHGASVGAQGRILRTTDGGGTWTSVPSGTTVNLAGVDFCCLTNGIAVGDSGVMLYTTDTGASWVRLPQLTTENLRGICYTAGSVGTVVGTNGIILRSTNGGISWTAIRGVTATLYEVSFVTEDIGTVVGAAGTILRTVNAGVSWAAQTSGTTQTLLGVSFTDENHGTVVGNGGVIRRTTNGGESWTAQSSGTTSDLTSVTMVDRFLGYIVGDNGLILKTSDGGSNWFVQPSGTNAGLKEVSFTNAYTGTAVGTQGTIIRTVTGGEPGAALSLVSPAGGETFAVLSTMPITWIGGGFASARIELSRDGGNSWETIVEAVPSGNQNYSYLVQGPPSDNCKVRVSDSANPALNDESDGIFSITPASVTRTCGFVSGWNLVSVPLTVPDYAVSTLFPTATSGAYSYDPLSGYQVCATLSNGDGYWLKFAVAQDIDMTGFELPADTIAVQTGWNLLGSVSSGVPVAAITTDPPGILTGFVYGFAPTGYVVATVIETGRAYWVKTTGPGLVILQAP